jgi:hypothetical protein
MSEMTTPSSSQKDLIAFLNYLSEKGLMNTQTAAARKASVNTLLSALDADETSDVFKLNLDDVAQRLLNKRGNEFKPDSIKVYKSRAASAIGDFKRYRADPLNFKVGLTPKSPAAKADKNTYKPGETSSVLPASTAATSHISTFVSPSEIEIVVPIPIRANTIVKIVGLPSDLTKQEAARIANVVNAFATVNETQHQQDKDA